MKSITATVLVMVVAVSYVSPEESESESDTCELYDEAGPWSTLLQEWALSADQHHARQGRIMALPPSKGYYVTDRIGLAPPPPPQQHHNAVPTHHKKHPAPPASPRPYDEWQPTPPPTPTVGKIVNRPQNPYKDKFKPSPSYNPPAPNQPIPVHTQQQQQQQHHQQHQQQQTVMVDRVDESKPTPQKQVSETDLYLLGAIEKLVYRADLMEKRLRKLEESVHVLVAGSEKKPEPCVTNFTRVGDGCYHISSETANWKGANYACRKLKSNMLELDTEKERKKLSSTLLSDKKTKKDDFWTGGLNPGLLWIWSHSARPVLNNSSHNATVAGEGRCLAWVNDPAARSLQYRGADCAARMRYVCELKEPDTISNEIVRAARARLLSRT